MDDNTRTVVKIKAQLSKYSGIISKDFSKAKQKLIKEMIYGIQATKDTKLSNISRSLKEEIKPVKTVDRLSRNLDDVDFTDKINNEICRLASSKVCDDMVIAIDPGDIRKKFAKKMEYICGIYDGSENKIAEGYWLCKAVAADIEHKSVIPLYCEAYSQNAVDFDSENHQLYKAIDTVSKHIGSKGIWAIDRGGDRDKIYEKFLDKDNPKRFVIRITKKRDLIHRGKRKNCFLLASCLPCDNETTLIKYEDGKEKIKIVHYNAVKVKLPDFDDRLFMVVVKGFSDTPMMLLTNCDVAIHTKESIWRIVEIYLTRWKCDESYRHIKQSYKLEELRVRSYTAIRNIVVLVLAVSYFASVYLSLNLKLKILVERIFLVSKRLFAVPSFFNYAIADGLYNLLFPDKTALRNKKPTEEDELQLCFDFF